MKKVFSFLIALSLSASIFAAAVTDTIVMTGFGGTTGKSYTTTATNGVSQMGIACTACNFIPSSGQIRGNKQSVAEDFSLYNTVAFPDAITKVEIIAKTDDSNYLKNHAYLATGTSSQAAVDDISAGTAWNDDFAWELDAADEITFIKIYSNEKFTNGNVTGVKIAVTYGGTAVTPKELVSIAIEGEATKKAYFVGESFDVAGLTVKGVYDDESENSNLSGITWEITPETFSEASESASVTVVAKKGDLESEPKVIEDIVVSVKEVPAGYTSVYTSNVEFVANPDTKASAAKVIYEETEYDALKMGTGSVEGSCVITIPAGAETLHFHAVAWKDKPMTMTVNGTEYTLAADAGISSSTPFTLAGDAFNYYFTYEPNGATVITFTAVSDKRFVLFGVNYELPAGAIVAPMFEPKAAEFDQSVEVSLSCETEGAAIYYTLDGTEPSGASTLYEAPFSLSATTTVKAIAIKETSSSAVAEKTYQLIPVYTLAELLAGEAPETTAQKVVLVLNNDVITKLYSKTSGVGGVYLKSGEQEMEIFQAQYAFPDTWAVGGTLSGRIMGDWLLYGETWELTIAKEEVNKLTYAAPTGLKHIQAENQEAKKLMLHNGRLIILRNGVRYDARGMKME